MSDELSQPPADLPTADPAARDPLSDEPRADDVSPVEDEGAIGLAPPAGRAGLDGEAGAEETVCPYCAYPLIGVREAGLSLCPECGRPIDFRKLRLIRRFGLHYELSVEVIRQILTQPGEYFARLPSPRRYVSSYPLAADFPGLLNLGLLAGVGVVAAMGALMCLLSRSIGDVFWGCSEIWMVVAWWFVMQAAHRLAPSWVRWVLRWAGHDAPVDGASRVTSFAGAVYLPMVAWMLLSLVILLPLLRFAPGVALRVGAFMGIGYLALGVAWDWIAMRAVEAELRPHCEPWWLVLALANPALLLPGAVVLWLSAAALLQHF